MARIALYIFLMQYRGSRHDSARAVVREALLGLLSDAGFNGEQAGAVFDAMVPRVGLDLDGYLMDRAVNLGIRNAWRGKNGLAALPDRSAAEQE